MRRALNVGTVGAVLAILLVFGLKAASVVSCMRLRSAVHRAGEAALGDAPTAATILVTREEMLRVARAHDVERPIVRAGIERRAEAPGTTTQVVVLELCVRSCHSLVERSLTRPLGPEELATLERRRIREHTSDRWRHHHD